MLCDLLQCECVRVRAFLVCVCLIGCVQEQVRQVHLQALRAPSELSYWTARGLPVAMGGRLEGRVGVGWLVEGRAGQGRRRRVRADLFVENLVCSGACGVQGARWVGAQGRAGSRNQRPRRRGVSHSESYTERLAGFVERCLNCTIEPSPRSQNNKRPN